MDNTFRFMERPKDPLSFDSVMIKLASPEKIRSWSFGEVKKPETINYRTFKPERDGLFCAKIFGPVKDWECLCGKYKRMKFKGTVCEKCGVEVTLSKVRRERMGHIELAAPVAHVWFFKGLPSKIGNFLDMTMSELEAVIYFEKYIVIEPGETKLKYKQLLNEDDYQEAVEEHGEDAFEVGMGAEAIQTIFKNMDLEELSEELKVALEKTNSVQTRRKLAKQLKISEAFRKSGNRPEWMIPSVIPVIPPDLRPLVPLDGGRFATSDLNDLYRRVINRNNRLKRLMELRAPEIIVRNEKRMLQESVAALFDNGRRGRVLKGPSKRPLKSLADMLKGKQGRFRQNLLGKRVDYSGRSVIVVGPDLKLYQCGLPKKMAIELFKPFIYHKLEVKGYAATIKSAKKMVENEQEEVWEVLDEVVKNHPVLLNRAPTLHRLSVQAFEPILIEGKAIQLHPLVCAAYNADFDGDQMAVHVPLSLEAQIETRMLMLSINNILSPSNGRPIAVPSQDIVLGCYYLTRERGKVMGEGKAFSNIKEVRSAYDAKKVHLQAKIRVRIDGTVYDTTVGRSLFYEIIPHEIPFSRINKLMNKGALGSLVNDCFIEVGRDRTVKFLDELKAIGFFYATKAGVSIGLSNMHIPLKKTELVDAARKEVVKVEEQYRNGLITKGEGYNKIIDVWSHVTDKVTEEVFLELKSEDKRAVDGDAPGEDFNGLYMMADSGARGSKAQIAQLAGMRGLMAKPSGEIIETPIIANFREGLTVAQYFISTHGAHKGLADTALKTANSGYLTRRLVDVAQDQIVNIHDCGTMNGIEMTALVEGGEVIQKLGERILGRVTLESVIDPFTKEELLGPNELIDEKLVAKIENAGVEQIKLRSVLTCEAEEGVCAKCYGRNLATGKPVEIGEAVGVIAAQSIGEPGTQLTMRTFHIGGVASKVAEQTKLQVEKGGIVKFVELKTVTLKGEELIVMNRNGGLIIQDDDGRERERYKVIYGARLKVKNGQRVTDGDTLAEWDPYTLSILTEVAGTVAYGDIMENVTMREEVDEVTGHSEKVILDHREEKKHPRISIKDDKGKTLTRYMMPAGAHVNVKEGERVEIGDIIAKIPRETTKTKDITGGLPRVAELFEARKPHEQATIAEVSGKVKYGAFVKRTREVFITTEDETEHKYLVPRGKHINVHEGDYVEAGEPLVDGALNPHDILNIMGEKELQKYLVNEIQEVYRLQGVTIADKHIEVIVRQMLRHLIIEDPGDTNFLEGEQVTKKIFQVENQAVIAAGGIPAKGKPVLLGITKASLATDSFISAASFQETTRVLTDVSISGKVDYLRGLKENVSMGRLIPAGTGSMQYQNIGIHIAKLPGFELKLEEAKEEEEETANKND
ncbi:MAG: DNA-directed RNA polymerase subunit beta' [Nitrospinota bacterium]|nr:DNA-directed RNA polymerase subunit beta' [Nitrospinota bacterium]